MELTEAASSWRSDFFFHINFFLVFVGDEALSVTVCPIIIGTLTLEFGQKRVNFLHGLFLNLF